MTHIRSNMFERAIPLQMTFVILFPQSTSQILSVQIFIKKQAFITISNQSYFCASIVIFSFFFYTEMVRSEWSFFTRCILTV